jgi:hypothetical protein
LRRYGASNLRDLKCVSQTIAKVIRISPGENLGLIVQTAKRSGMNDSVAITHKVIAVRVRGLPKTSAT